MRSDCILEMRGIVKQYPGVTALKGVDFSARRNAVHCLVGENGAGKSTLIKILTCVERMTEGSIAFDGKPKGLFRMPSSSPRSQDTGRN